MEGGGRGQPQHGGQADVKGQLCHRECRQKNTDLPKFPTNVQDFLTLKKTPENVIMFVLSYIVIVFLCVSLHF